MSAQISNLAQHNILKTTISAKKKMRVREADIYLDRPDFNIDFLMMAGLFWIHL